MGNQDSTTDKVSAFFSFVWPHFGASKYTASLIP